jgi:hypothetical protein
VPRPWAPRFGSCCNFGPPHSTAHPLHGPPREFGNVEMLV